MKFDKVNMEVLKKCLKEKSVNYAKDDNWYYIFMDNNVGIYRIHKTDWYVDLEKDYPGGSRNHIRYFENAVKLFDVPADAMLLNNTGELKIHPSQPKITLAVYTTYNDEKIYIDTKLLANFENYTLKSVGPKNIIFVYEGDLLVGIVMPVNI